MFHFPMDIGELTIDGITDTALTALTTTQEKQHTVFIDVFLQHPFAFKNGCHIAIFSKLRSKQANYIRLVKPAPLSHPR